MNRRVRRRLAALGAFVVLLVPPLAAAQKQKEWTWKDGKGKVKTRAELKKILAEHKLWWESGHTRGSRANMTGVDLTGADLTGANLIEANLSGARLDDADLSGANLIEANLSGAKLDGADLTGTDLGAADLTDADLFRADLTGAELFEAKLSGASLTEANLTDAKPFNAHLIGAHLGDADLSRADLAGADLSDAKLDGADLTGAHLSLANLTGADLTHANLVSANVALVDLSGAKLVDAELKDANFLDVDLQGVTFEPTSIPEIRSIAAAKHLEFATYDSNPDALVQLRKQFQENGFRTQERKITYALSRRKAQLDGPVERWFQRVAFDLTCQYGMNPGRALQIWLGLLLFCWLVYAVFIHIPIASGIYQIRKLDRYGDGNEIEEKIYPWKIPSKPLWRYPFRLIHQELRVFFWAGFFSLMSAFNIGFRDINFGRWLRLLPRAEYDLKAKGWARTVAGFQSLISVYLIALWVLTYFGRPFE